MKEHQSANGAHRIEHRQRQDCRGLRVLLVGAYPPPFGGIATHLTALIPGLKERGADDVAVITMGDAERTETAQGATIYRVRLRNHVSEVAMPASWPLLWKVFRALRGGGVDAAGVLRDATKAVVVDRVARAQASNVVAFYHSDAHFELVPLAEHWLGRRGTVLTVFGEVYGNPDFMRRHRKIIEKVIAAPAAVWASSAHCARSFSTIGIDRCIEPIFIGVELDGSDQAALRAEFRNANAVSSDDVVVLFMGRFIRDMGLDALIDVIPELLRAEPRLKFVLAGATGDLSDGARELAAESGGRVFVLQNVPFAVQASLYAAADVVVAPSFDQRACMGLSIKEGMAASRAVVATDSGGIPEAVVHGETGYLVPLDPVTRAADQTRLGAFILELAADDALRERFGKAGRARTEELFAVERTIDRVAGLFMKVRPAEGANA